MRLLEMYLSGALLLTLVVVVLKNPSGTNTILTGLGNFNRNIFTTLQGGGSGSFALGSG